MNRLERFRATMECQPRDRAPLKKFPWPAWPETAERWASGGHGPSRRCHIARICCRLRAQSRGDLTSVPSANLSGER